MSSNPFFSICIPTRNRAETLKFCLKSAIHQNFENYEIIVSDNSDGLESKNVVDGLNSSKIRYFKQEVVLPMTENFEFAVSKANGEYVICIGDDDGLVIDSLGYLFNFIQKYQAKVVKCCTVTYCWKGSLINKDSTLTHPTSRAVTEVNSKSVLQKVFAMEFDYFHLPMIYYGAIHKTVLARIKEIQGSYFVDSASVDIYSGMCIAWVEENFFISDYPFTIMGNSAKSNGTNHHQRNNKNNDVSKEFIKLGKIDLLYQKYNVVKLHHNVKSITWLSMMQFVNNFKLQKEDLFINDKKFFLRLNNPNVILHKINFDAEIEACFTEANYSKQWMVNSLKTLGETPSYYPDLYSMVHFFTGHKTIDPLLFDVDNVYDAAILCYNLRESSINDKPISLNPKNIKEARNRKLKLAIKVAWQKLIDMF
jgi:glycosyltransferase involved in cell wall biosynthesis